MNIKKRLPVVAGAVAAGFLTGCLGLSAITYPNATPEAQKMLDACTSLDLAAGALDASLVASGKVSVAAAVQAARVGRQASCEALRQAVVAGEAAARQAELVADAAAALAGERAAAAE